MEWKVDEAKTIIRSLLVEGRRLTMKLAEREEIMRSILEENGIPQRIAPVQLKPFGMNIKSTVQEFNELFIGEINYNYST